MIDITRSPKKEFNKTKFVELLLTVIDGTGGLSTKKIGQLLYLCDVDHTDFDGSEYECTGETYYLDNDGTIIPEHLNDVLCELLETEWIKQIG